VRESPSSREVVITKKAAERKGAAAVGQAVFRYLTMR
jgi:hypothetical protein